MTAPRTHPTPDLAQALLTFRIIGGSLGAGVTLFAGVSWLLNRQEGPRPPTADPTLLFNVWLAVAVGAMLAAILFWRARVEPLLDERVTRDERLRRAGELQTNVVIVWALMEAPALLAVVVYYLYDLALAGVLGVALMWAALAVTWPKREWFGPDR